MSEKLPTSAACDGDIYRLLQRHLDQQPVGFPATKQGADIRLLQRLFTAEEARLALHLSHKPMPTQSIIECAIAEFSPERIGQLLESLLQKGAIGLQERNGTRHWHLLALWLGMYEAQDGQPSAEFVDDAGAYMQSLEYRMSLYTIRPSQMRTIPINQSVPVEHHTATYNRIRSIIEEAEGPFVVLNCTCRNGMAMQNKTCSRTHRLETCLVINHMGANALRRGHGREISRKETLDLLEQNQGDGLVLQLDNAQRPEFICSCCGCCCAWLRFQKSLPRPTDYWTTSFSAAVDSELCARCGECVARCQVNAVTLPESGSAVVDLRRCIGCGLCVPTCAPGAIQLKEKESENIPPMNREELQDLIQQNRKNRKTGSSR